MESPFDRRRLERARRRLVELRVWRNAYEHPVPEWSFAAGDRQESLRLGDFWPVVETPVRLSATAQVPPEWGGQPVELELWLGGEGFVQLSTGTLGGLNPFHHVFRVADSAQGGERVEIVADVVPKGMFGTHVAEPRIERAHLVVPQYDVRALERDLTMIADACEVLGEHEVVPFLLDAIDAAYDALAQDWPSATDVVITRLVEAYVNPIGSAVLQMSPADVIEAADVLPVNRPLWSLPPAPGKLEPLPDAARAAVERARAAVAGSLERTKEIYPPVGRLALTGHAHIDLAWLWPLAETRRKARRTFASVLDLMERYEDFTFNQSSAQLYAWLEEDDPALLEQIKRRIAEGRWEPVGGSWAEPDCQVTGGESFVRQLFYGQRYFEAAFGRRNRVAWLPDVFGFSAGIPQLLRGAGLDGFFTIKLTWSETNVFPYDLFEWEGVDGSRVTAHMFRNPGHGYNGNVAPLDLVGTWRNFTGKRFHPESLFSFGWGDGGGGPTAKMLENYERLKSFPALPRLRMAQVEDFYAALPREGLPRWVGELYLEYHRGTLTTQGKVKFLNRAAEHRLLEAEAFASVAQLHGFAYPHETLDAAWKTLLLNQFHDILPGSSIAEVYEDAHRMLGEVVERATEARDAALAHIAGRIAGPEGDGVLVANAGLAPRPLSVLLPGRDRSSVVFDAAGEPLPTQETADGLLVHDPGHAVPGVGWLALAVAPGSPPEVKPGVRAAGEADGALIENDLLRVEIGGDGTIHRIFDKAAGREALADRGNQLWAYVDKPRVYDAWDIEETHENEGQEIGGVERIEVVEAGPLRAAVRVERSWRGSRIVQTYRLLAGSRRLDIETYVDWHERMILLKARFPLAVHTREATYETMYGVLQRPTHRNTSWEATRFEVAAHRFADLSEPGYGVALLNNGKYGHGVLDNVLTLSLLRGPIYPHPLADEGEHRFTYSLLPHEGDWTAAGVTHEAFALNSPLAIAPLPANRGNLPAHTGLVGAEGVALALGSLKQAADGEELVLRVYEPHGARGGAVLRFDRTVKRAEPVNLLEEPVERATPVTVQADTVRFEVRPFEVVTLRITL